MEQEAPRRRERVTTEATLDPRNEEIRRLRADLADAQAALAREIAGRPHAEEMLRALVDGVPGFVSILAADGQVEVVNRQIMTYCGKTLEELRNWGTAGVVHDDDLQLNESVFVDAIARGVPYDHEIRLRRFDGVYRWFSNRGVPVRDEAGKVLRWYVLLTDIDDRKRAEEALAASERRLTLAIDATPALIWSATPGGNGHTDFVNRHFADYVGTSYEQLENKRWRVTIHPDDYVALNRVWDAVRATGKAGQAEARLRRHDGEYRWFLLRTNPMFDENGNVVRWYGVNTDIEDRKQAEQALAASERALQETVDAIPIQVICNTVTGLYESANRPWHDYTGLSPDAAQGRGWQQAFHPDDLPHLVDAWSRMLRSGEGGDTEGRLRRADGVYRWFLMRSSPLRNANGKVVRWYSTNVDIERRWGAEQALAESERSLRQTIDTIPAIVFSDDADGSNEHISDGWHDYTGVPAEQSAGFGWADAVHPDDRSAMMARWLTIRETGESTQMEARVRRHDGVYRWFLFSVASLRDPAGKISKWFSTVTDIEDRKQAEAELRRGEAMLAQGEAVSETGSFLWNLETREIRWSEQLSRIFRFEIGSRVTIRRIAERTHPLDRALAEEMANKARAGVDSEYEYRLLLPDGAVRHMHFVAKSTRDSAGRLEYMGTIQDITDRKLAEQEHDRVRSELAHAARAMSLGVLTASLAHEVNQPLAGIITNANTCLRMLSADPPNVKGALETARRTIRDGNRAAEVVSRLRTLFSKKEFVTETVDLSDAGREVLALSMHEFQRHHIIVFAEFAKTPVEVVGDRVQIQQVMLNLLLNACDAIKGNAEGLPRIIVMTTADDGAGACTFTVHDSGPGIPPGTLGKLFDAFYTTKPDGMGIGLSVSRSIIDRHRGRLWADDSERGAIFAFSIPSAAPAGLSTAPQ